ncbi:peptidoglycan DD-metalloendopeptidase family protein [Patescibacteria group bacterium]|nr:peptidoglycan DD-metalloendopeptidase family protein [Patescibacteria group bacterium]
MKAPVIAFCVGICCSLFFGTYLSGFVRAQSAEVVKLQAEISERNERLKEIDAEIKQYQGELLKVGAEKSTLQRAINTLELERKKTAADIAYTQNRIGSTDLEINKLNLEVNKMQDSIDKNKDAIAEIIRELNASDQDTLLLALLRTENISELWDNIEQLDSVKNAMHTRVQELTTLKADVEEKRADEQDKRNGLVKLKSQYSDQQTLLANNKQEKDQLLKTTKNQEAAYQALLAEKQAAKDKFEQELRGLESKLKFILDPNTIPTNGSQVFAWPIDNVRITQFFGDTEFARTGAYSGRGHNGIDIGVARGSIVRSALAGKVIAINTQVAPMCQYGKWVLVRHANGLTTLYAHLSLVSVESGQEVGTGETVGYSGDTGYATGPHLHFTVYASGAVNFTQYTCNSGVTLTIPVSAPSGYLNPMNYLPPAP